MEKQKIEFSWEDTGTLDIEVVGNLYATLRYAPSNDFIEKTLAQFRKGSANTCKTLKYPTNPRKRKVTANKEKRALKSQEGEK